MFWGIERDHREDKWNCELVRVPVNSVLAMGFTCSQHFADKTVLNQTSVVTVPVLTNTRKIAKDEHVVLKWSQVPKKDNKPGKERTWVDEAKEADKGKAKQSSKGASEKRKQP